MSISELVAVVTPPSGLSKPAGEAWKAVESKLQVRLPPDLKELVSTYGSGKFLDRGKHWIKIYNPCSAQYLDEISTHHTNLEAFKEGEGDEYVPYGVYPTQPGLFAVGSDANGNEIYWLTEGLMDKWPIVIRTASSEYERFDGPLTTFLAKAFRREIKAEAWPKSLFATPANLAFEPEKPSVPKSAYPRTIYELYVANGNKAGFWARDIHDQPGVKLLIREIDGKSAGPLPGIPVEYNRAHITADLYIRDKLIEQNTNVSTGYRQMYELA